MSVSEEASAPQHAITETVPAPEPAASGPLAGDPALIGVPTFIVGSIALGLVLVGYVPASAVGASLAIILAATGIGQLVSSVWAAALGQSAVAAIFGIFSGFWLSYGLLVLGLTNNWFGIATKDAVGTQGLFLISWLITIVLLTVATLRLPLAFTALFVLVDIALLLVLIGTLDPSTGLSSVGGIVVFAFAAIGAYLFLNVASVATGGKPLPLGSPVQKSG